MEKIYSKLGGLSDLKKITDFLHDFTGYIKVDKGVLFYIDSKLIVSLWGETPVDIRSIFKKLPEEFLIEVYRCSRKDLEGIIREKLGDDALFKVEEDPSIRCIPLDTYTSIYNYVDSDRCEVILIPKKYCSDKGIMIFKNGEEILAVYRCKDKILEGSKAINKIKAVFAVSEVRGFIRRISEEEIDEYLRTYPRGILKRSMSLEELIKKIKNREPIKVVHNSPLVDILTEEPSLIEIDKDMYIVSNSKKVVYAYFRDYKGDKAYKYIKNYCLFRDIEIKIYALTNEEYKMFKEFRKCKVKNS